MSFPEARASLIKRYKNMGVVALLYFAAFVAAAHSLDYRNDSEFMLWLEKYYDGGNDPGKMYPSWRKNADFVNQHNAEGHSYTVSLNKFAHLVSAVSSVALRAALLAAYMLSDVRCIKSMHYMYPSGPRCKLCMPHAK